MKHQILISLLLLIVFTACDTAEPPPGSTEAQTFLDEYAAQYQQLAYAASEAEWASNTRIVEGDTTNAVAARRANEALAAFTGSEDVIQRTRALLERDDLSRLQRKQLEQILYIAANNPQTVPDVVRERIRLETELTEQLFGYDFQINGRSITPNEIDRILRESNDLQEREQAWAASKEVGAVLRDGLAEVRDLRNQTVQALGYDDYFGYQVSDYGMTTEEMKALMNETIRQVYPLYRELHTWARYELAARYGVAEVPDLIPAHWLPNRWGQDWSALVNVEGLDIGAALAPQQPEDLVKTAEDFYVSLGFDPLPASFYEKSSLYPVGPDAGYKKNTHASAWHLDLDRDVRSLMSVEPTPYWYETTHHELGHIYYYMSYSTPDVPILLRGGANRAFHEAVGSLLGLASMQQPYLEEVGLVQAGAQTDEIQLLLREALNYIVFIPWSAGVMTFFEHDLYAENLPADAFNARWWQYKQQFQGIAPPGPRGARYNDAASKTHIVNDPGQYYDYALSYLILFQLHNHIATEILNQNPRATNYYGSEEVGQFLRDLLSPGATRDWRELLRKTTGSDLSAEPMLNYFEPLMAYLRQVNEGREHTLPALR